MDQQIARRLLRSRGALHFHLAPISKMIGETLDLVHAGVRNAPLCELRKPGVIGLPCSRFERASDLGPLALALLQLAENKFE